MAKHRIFFFSALFFLMGVFIESAGVVLGWFGVLLAVALSSVPLFYYSLKKRTVSYFVCALCLFLTAGYLYSDYRQRSYESLLVPFDYSIREGGKIISDPYIKNGVQIFTVKTFGSRQKNLRVAAKYGDLLRYGDEVFVFGYAERPDQESYLRYLRKENAHASLAFPKIVFVKQGKESSILGKLYDLRRGLVRAFNSMFVPDEAALASGVLLGDGHGFTKKLIEDFQKSGVSHIVALSGFNVTVLVTFSFGVLLFFMRRRFAFSAALILIVLFVLMTGAPPSLVRAAIMSFLILLAREFGRFQDSENVFSLSALLMVLHEPGVLYFDLGFQLSFLALLGIVYLQPVLMTFFPKRGLIYSVASVVFATVSAEVMVAPLLLNVFSSFSLVGIVTNLLIVPFVPALMFLIFLSGVAFYVFPFMVEVFSYPSHLLLEYFLFVIRRGADLDPGVSEVYLWFCTGVLFLLLSVVFLFRYKKEGYSHSDGFFLANTVK